LTDIHSWVGGHYRQEPEDDAGLGDVLSFWLLLKEYCDANDMDCWLVNNGDFVHGTGLTGNGDPSSLVPLLEIMPWDAVNCGNHELYEESIVEYMTRPGGYVDWWGDRYLTANVMKARPQKEEEEEEGSKEEGGSSSDGDIIGDEDLEPLGRRYKILEGKKSNLLVFGFLYNLPNPCDLIHIQNVEDVVQQQWFLDALNKVEEYDAILILAHMDLVDPLVTVILQAIRDQVGPGVPVQFVTGHTHYRGYDQLDPMSMSVEAGRYLDTVGFVSFPTAQSAALEEGRFEFSFLDANRHTLKTTLHIEDDDYLYTKEGSELTEFIAQTREKKGLLEEVGCAPRDYHYNASLDDKNSLWALYRDKVVPQMFFSNEDTEDVKSIMYLSKESWRYDIFSKASLVMDDIWAVAPFFDKVTYMGTFEGAVIRKLNATMNSERMSWLGILPDWIMIGTVESATKAYALYTHEYNIPEVKEALQGIVPNHEIEPENTDYTSTMLWSSFVIENWACDGLSGKLPDWFPKPDHIAEKLGTNGDDMENVFVIVILVFLVLILLVCSICCWLWLRYLCMGHQPISQEELDTLALEDDDDDDDDGGENGDKMMDTPATMTDEEEDDDDDPELL
jgi:2',3'-cyclic-nucleotide 2'-phosphodiesterase (5'-nucleotidase family)